MEVLWLGRSAYVPTWHRMRAFSESRTDQTSDQLWVVEHPPVFTLGLAGRREHLLDPGSIPVVQVDRGGQVTYHGPGQVVIYILIDLPRRGLGVRRLVTQMEQAVIGFLEARGLAAESRPKAPGVYVEGAKIASLGIRIRRGRSYHGLAFNLAMDLEPFTRINPCGFAGLRVTDLSTLGVTMPWDEAARGLCRHLRQGLG